MKKRNHRQQVASQEPKREFLSPFRYPGGKSWFVKIARIWLTNQTKRPNVIVEPFAGGACISLAAVNEGLVAKSVFAELDHDVSAAWQSMLNGEARWLIAKVLAFKVGRRGSKTCSENVFLSCGHDKVSVS